MKLLYEVVDQTLEDIYWTLGIWESLKDAIEACSVGNSPECALGANIEDYVKFHIQERKIGFSDTGKHVATVEWDKQYDDDDDYDGTWSCSIKTKETNNA